jgi:quercetin dioxygenase-like cupin family protein
MRAQVAAYDEVGWVEEAPGVRAKPVEVAGARWALVEYAPGAGRPEWCHEGHRGHVVSGAIRYEFDDGQPALTASAGQGFLLPGGQGHRGKNDGNEAALLVVIDDPA